MSLIDVSEEDLDRLLSPKKNLHTLAEVAGQQWKMEVCRTGDVSGDVLGTGSPVAGRLSGTGGPGPSDVGGGPCGPAGACGPSASAGGSVGKGPRGDGVSPMERTLSPTGRSQRWDRERRNTSADKVTSGVRSEERAIDRDDALEGGQGAAGALDPVSRIGTAERGMSHCIKPVAVGTKLGVYDGNSAIETFLARFENCSDYFGWTAADRLYHLKASLVGAAGQILWNVSKSASVEHIIQLLRNRFGAIHQQERFRAELRCKKRKPNETLQSVYTDVCKLISLAYPGESSPLLDLVARDAFLQCLNDADLCVRILEKEPTSIDQALSIACRLEAYDKCAGRAEKSGCSDADFAHVKPKYVRTAAATNDIVSQSDRLGKQIQMMQQTLDNFCQEFKSQREELNAQRTEVEFLRSEVAKGFNRNDSMQSSQGLKRESDVILPSPTEFADQIGAGQFLASNVQGPGETVTGRATTVNRRIGPCYICSEYGHLARDHKKRSREAASLARGIVQSEAISNVYMRVTLDRKFIMVLLDTGCDSCVCGRRLIPDAVLKATTQRLVAANGTPIELIGEATIFIGINGVIMPVKVAVTELIDEMILGIPFLTQHNCCWDFGKSKISIDGRQTRLYGKPLGNKVRRIYAQRDVTIPAGSAMDVPAIVTRPDLQQYSPAWATEPRRLGDYVLTARMLFTDEATSTWLRSVNLSSRAYVVRQGSLLAEAEAVSVVDVEDNRDSASTGQAVDTAGGSAGGSHGTMAGTIAGHPCEDGTAATLSRPDDSAGSTQADGFVGRAASSGNLMDLTDRYAGDRMFSIVSEPGRLSRELEYSDSAHVDDLIDRLPDELTDEQRIRAATLIRDYAHLFSKSETDLGLTDMIAHKINTGTHRPIKESLRRHPQALLPLIDDFVEDLLKRGLIEPGRGDWAMNLTVARKSNGSLRYCIDARKVNLCTVTDAYALPRIDTCLESFGSARYFCTIDAVSAYWQVPIKDEESRDRTAFLTRKGLWRWKVMGYGLCGAPATFQRLMDLILVGLQFEICLAFLDDVIIYGSTFEETCTRLKKVFDRIAESKIKLRADKCVMFTDKVKFLGYVVSRDGISPDPEKIKAVVNWPACRNVTEVRSFLALCSYNRRHIFQFAEKARPLYDLTKKNHKFAWSDREQSAFEELKRCLTTAPVLASPIDGGAYVLETDASTHSLSAILSQYQNGVLRVIAYASRVLQDSERRYCSTKLELLAVVYGLKQYRHFLLARKFVIKTDNAALTSLLRTPEPLAQQGRWLDLISEYEFQITYRPAAQNGAADALSRRPCERDDISKMCTQCRSKADRINYQNSGNIDRQSVDETAEQCMAMTRQPETQGSQAGSSTQLAGACGPLMSPEPAENDVQWNSQGNTESFNEQSEDISGGPLGLPAPAVDNETAVDISADQIFTPDGQLSVVNLRQEQNKDATIVRVKALLQPLPVVNNWSVVLNDTLEVQTLYAQRQTLEIKDEILYRQFQKADGTILYHQAVIPKSLRIALLSHLHGGLLTGHFGQQETEKRVAAIAY